MIAKAKLRYRAACKNMREASAKLAIDLATTPDDWEQHFVTHDWDHICEEVRMARESCVHAFLHADDEPTIEGTVESVIRELRELEERDGQGRYSG